MLLYVPVRFDLYRPLKPHLRWTLQCLVGFADRAGRCWPSVRKLAEVTGLGKSTVSRHLAELARIRIVSRHRKPGGVYSYTIDSRFLPEQRRVSHQRAAAVPPAQTEEQPIKKKEAPRGGAPWQNRMLAWEKAGFWLPQWGEKPGTPGCMVPACFT
jgi:DNA-binding transcriptional ArsR family regulator